MITPPALAQVAPPAPWFRQPHESEDDFACFAIWALTTPRPPIPSELRLVAMTNGWEQRASYLDGRLAQVRSLADTTRAIAVDAVQVLSVELEALAAASRARPGNVRTRDLVQLLSVIASLGGFDAAKLPEHEGLKPDYSRLDNDELETLERLVAKSLGR